MKHSKIELPPLILKEVREVKNPQEEESPQKGVKRPVATKHAFSNTPLQPKSFLPATNLAALNAKTYEVSSKPSMLKNSLPNMSQMEQISRRRGGT